MGNISVVKLISGDEIVAEVTNISNKESVSLKNPMLLVMQQKPDGGVGVAILPYASSVEDDTIEVGYDKIIYIHTAKSELIEYYNKVHGNIVVPTQKIIS